MKASLIAFTEKGFSSAEKIAEILSQIHWEAELSPGFGEGKKGLGPWAKKAFENSEALIFIGAAGIATRAIAPHVKSKAQDPAVIVIDEAARFVIPILSGHLGGANELSEKLAKALGATAVITTATDVNGVFPVDDWARQQGLLVLNPGAIKSVSSRLLAEETIKIRSRFPILGKPPKGVFLTDGEDYDVYISNKTAGKKDCLKMTAPVCVLGVGCRKGTEVSEIEKAFKELILSGGIEEKCIAAVCSIDLKAEEKGILDFCKNHNFPFKTFSAEELMALSGDFTPSDFVRKTTGADNICERSAVLGAGEGASLIVKKHSLGPVTMALTERAFSLKFEEGYDE